MKKLTIVALFAPLCGFANFSINLDFGYVLNSSSQPVNSNSLAVLVVDKNGDGFTGSTGGLTSALLQGETLALNNLFGADDQIIAVLNANLDPLTAGNGQVNYGGATPDLAYTGGITVGDSLALYFFPAVSSTSTLLDGKSYGFFGGVGAGTSIPSYSDTNWKVPADGGWNLSGYTPAFFADLGDTFNNATDPSAANLTANFTVPAVPEPSTYAAIFGAVALLVSFRRKNK